MCIVQKPLILLLNHTVGHTPIPLMEVGSTLETLCISSMSHTMDNVQLNISIIYQPLSHTFRELSLFMLAKCFRAESNEIKCAVILKES
jgi:hypothetical protein